MRLMNCGLALMAILVPATALAADEDFQIWTTLNASGSLSGPILGSLELGRRFDQDAGRIAVTIVRPTIGYRVSDKVSVLLGYARQQSERVGLAAQVENRYFTQLNWNIGKVASGALTARTRFEARTMEGANDTGFRLRQQLRLAVPLSKGGTSAVVSSEVALSLNSTDWGARGGFDQTRNFVGVSVPLVKTLSLETGYLNRYQRRNGRADRMDHVVPVTLNYRF